MSKSRKSKFLATMMCAAVMAGLHAAPVMAADLNVEITDGQLVAIENEGKPWLEEKHPVRGSFTIAGSDIAAALDGENLSVKDLTASGNVTVNGKLEGTEATFSGAVYAKNFNGVTLENSSQGITVGGINLTEVKGQVDTNTTNITGLSEKVGSFDNRITANEMDIAGLNQNTQYISTVGKTTLVSSDLTVQGNVKASDVTTNNGVSLKNVGARVDGFDVRITTNENNIEELSGKLTVNETNIKNVTGRVEEVEVATMQLNGRVTTVENKTKDISRDGNTTTVNGVEFIKQYDGSTDISTDGTVWAQDGQFDKDLQVGVDKKVTLTADGNIKADGTLTLGEKTLTGTNIGKINGLFGSSTEDRPTIYAGDGSFVGGVQFNNGNVKADSITLAGIEGENKDVATAINDLSGKYSGIGTDLSGLTGRVEVVENKTTAIEYTPGSDDPNAPAYLKMGTTKVEGKLEADIVSADQGTIGGITMAGGAISAGAFAVDDSGNITANNLVTDKYNVNNTFSELEQKTSGIVKTTSGTTIVEGVSFGQGRIDANGGVIGDVELIGGKVNGVDVVQVRDTVARNVIDINDLQQKTSGIVKTTSGTTVVEGVSFGQGRMDADYVLADAGKIGDVEIADGRVDGVDVSELRDSVAGNIVDVSDLKRKTTDIEYADGVTTIGKDGNNSATVVVNSKDGYVTINNGMITADAESGYVTMGSGIDVDTINGNITANNFYTDKYDLNAIGEQLDNLETNVGTTNENVAGIKRNGETTTIEETLNVSKDYIGANIEGSIFGITNEDVSIAHGSNGVSVNNMGVHLSGNVYFDGKDGNSYTLADLEDRVSDLEDKTQNITGSKPGTGEGGSTVPPTTDGHTGIEGDVTVGGEINAGSGTIGGVTMEDGKVTAGSATIGDVQVSGSLNVADKVTADKDGVTVVGDNGNKVVIDGNDVSVTDKDGNTESIMGNAQAIENLGNTVTSEVNRLDNRISQVEDRIDKVGAMSAAIANLRTMGYDPAAPTEIAVGLGQYRSETGAALGLFHYPNRDFMLSLSVSTSGDEVMGGIGATWKFGRKTPDEMLQAEKEKAAAKKLAKARKAEAMKKAAAEAEKAKKVAAQQAKHAKMAAEKAAQ